MIFIIKLKMKLILSALLVVLVVSGSWNDVVSYLPTCYTGLPFKLPLTNGNLNGYTYLSSNLPSFASIDRDGVIIGSTAIAGAFPVHVSISDNNGVKVIKQYILNVADAGKQGDSLWSTKSSNYYSRNVENPFAIVSDSNAKLILSVGDNFHYSFRTKNNIGKPVFAFLNLPEGLSGDNYLGSVSGSFATAGIYTLGVESADQGGSSAEGYVSVTVNAGSAIATGGVQVLNQITIPNNVPFVFDLSQVQAQQNAADKLLFDALAAVNAAKADAADKQAAYDSLNVRLAAAETTADQAAVKAATAKSSREMGAQRLTITQKALNDAEDQLNLAFLYQAGAKDNVKKAQNLLNAAQATFDAASKALNNAEVAVQAATADVTTKNNILIQAKADLANAQKDFDRVNQDLNEAKNALAKAVDAQQRAQLLVQTATNNLTLAKQAYAIATEELKEAIVALANAEAKRQAALAVLQNATSVNQQATTILGSAEWDLNQAIAALNVAQAAKEAADRTSAMVLANGTPLKTTIVSAVAFSGCKVNDLPKYGGSARVIQVVGNDRALLSTGNTILFGDCTVGRTLIAVGKTITINGFINVNNKCIEVYSAIESKY